MKDFFSISAYEQAFIDDVRLGFISEKRNIPMFKSQVYWAGPWPMGNIKQATVERNKRRFRKAHRDSYLPYQLGSLLTYHRFFGAIFNEEGIIRCSRRGPSHPLMITHTRYCRALTKAEMAQ
jgi:hypothetical protein